LPNIEHPCCICENALCVEWFELPVSCGVSGKIFDRDSAFPKFGECEDFHQKKDVDED